jgi:2-C-methyl-D-erythritol 4-phosphate cytidylyltransferase
LARKDEYTNAAIITAAGLSSRMGPGLKKELRIIDGKPVIGMCIEAFRRCECFSTIVVTHPAGRREAMESALKEDGASVRWVAGGVTRQESVYNALEELATAPPDIVLIHDGARPWVTPELILSVLAGTRQHGACIPVVPLTDAPKKLSSGGFITEHLDKSALANAQTPQGFTFRDILEAHRVARESGNDYADDAEAYNRAIGAVFAVSGEPANRKITYDYDIA